MAIIRCDNGHYYDDTKFAQCPHCGVLPIMNESAEQKIVKKPKRFSFFKRTEKVIPDVNEDDDDRTIALPEEEDDRTVAFYDDDDRTIALADDDRTMALTDDDQTVAFQEQEEHLTATAQMESHFEVQEECIAGWLVCTVGTDRGRDYRIYKGFNRIVLCHVGVKVVMEVGDNDEVAGAVVYDDSSNRFFIMPQQTDLKLNGTLMTEAKELKTGDEIETAQETFIFVAFCGEGRRWDAENK